MTILNIHLAQQVAKEREQEIIRYAEARRQLLAATPEEEHTSWTHRLFHHHVPRVTRSTYSAA